MAVTIGGITRDQNRVFNKILGTYQNVPGQEKSYHEKTPLPIDVIYNVTIMTRFQQDMDQIISHIIPYINPYFTVSWRTPLRPDFEIRSNVFWNGNVNITYPTDINATQVARVVAELSFTFKGWMFQALQDPVGVIYSSHSTYVDVLKGIPSEFLLAENYRQSTDSSDYLEYHGVPPQPKAIAPYYAKVGEQQMFDVWGPGFTRINNVYLSGAPFNNTTTFNPFSGYNELSATNPPFSGIKIDPSKWSYDKDSFMTFVMPSAQNPGRVDLIIEGPAGYGKLTEFVRVNTFNPYLSGTPEYDSFVPYQFPFLEGIIVNP
jgi:hypothetical protein